MINQEGGNTDWFNRRAFHPVTGREEKLSASKLPAEESLTCLTAERERRGGASLKLSALKPPVHGLQLSQLALSWVSLTLSFLIRQAQFRVEALLIGHPSKTHAESKLPAIDWLSLSCATHTASNTKRRLPGTSPDRPQGQNCQACVFVCVCMFSRRRCLCPCPPVCTHWSVSESTVFL